MDLRNEIIEQIVLVLRRHSGRLERLHRLYEPAHWDRCARHTREKKRIQTVECRVAESRATRFGSDNFEDLNRSGWRSSKTFTLAGSDFPVAGSSLNASRRS